MKKFIFASALFLGLSAGVSAQKAPDAVAAVLEKHTCTSCHAPTKKMIGPSWTDIAQKKYTKKRFTALVAKPEPANWPNYTPMAPLPKVPKEDLGKIYDWVATLAK